MTIDLSHFRFVAKALPNKGTRPREMARTMSPHPLSYMELPYDPEYTLYNSRLTPEALNHATDDQMYWAVRTNVIFRHTGELPIEISGPDAKTLLNRIFTRNIGKVKPGRCSYQFACYHDGGMITDGVLMRLAEDRFWMTQADGDLFSWYKAHAEDLDVKIDDPNVWVSQIQGPRSLELLAAVVDGSMPQSFRYMARISPEAIIRTALATDTPDTEAFFLSCTGLQAVDAVAALEGETGKPVVTSNQASAWALMNHAGLNHAELPQPFDPWGRLFRHAMSSSQRVKTA